MRSQRRREKAASVHTANFARLVRGDVRIARIGGAIRHATPRAQFLSKSPRLFRRPRDGSRPARILPVRVAHQQRRAVAQPLQMLQRGERRRRDRTSAAAAA